MLQVPSVGMLIVRTGCLCFWSGCDVGGAVETSGYGCGDGESGMVSMLLVVESVGEPGLKFARL